MSVQSPIFNRLNLLLGEETMERVMSKRVIIFGVGGVGSWCAESLVRSGISHLTIVDSDCVCITNVNRQLQATTKTVGQVKVEVLKERLLEINPKAEIQRSARYKPIEDFTSDSVSVSAETIGLREKTEYVFTDPYREFELFYDDYKHLNISLNGAVKSVVQTEVLKHGNSPKDIFASQQTWDFLPNGHLFKCLINKIFLKDYLINDFDNVRPLSEENFDSTALPAYYNFDGAGRLRQVTGESVGRDIDFEYDKNGLLTKISTYYPEFDGLSETVITLNDNGKPVRVEVFNYKDEMKRRQSTYD